MDLALSTLSRDRGFSAFPLSGGTEENGRHDQHFLRHVLFATQQAEQQRHRLRDHRVVRANVSLERGILDAIDRAARERSLTRSAFIAQAARNEIESRH